MECKKKLDKAEVLKKATELTFKVHQLLNDFKSRGGVQNLSEKVGDILGKEFTKDSENNDVQSVVKKKRAK